MNIFTHKDFFFFLLYCSLYINSPEQIWVNEHEVVNVSNIHMLNYIPQTFYNFNATSNVWMCHMHIIFLNNDHFFSTSNQPSKDLFLLLTSSTQLENRCFLWLFALYYLQQPSHFCCTSSSEVHLTKFTLISVCFSPHDYSFWKHLPLPLPTSSFPIPFTPISQDCTLFSSFSTHHLDSLLH